MNNTNPLRERLLAQFEPDRDKLANYRKEIQAMLERNERKLKLQKWYAGSIWVFVVLLGVALMYLGQQSEKPGAIWMGLTACFFVSVFSLELVKYFINRARVDVLKHVKGLELQVLELKEQLGQRKS
jgi:hypothetical protein